MEGFAQTVYNRIINNPLWSYVLKYEYDNDDVENQKTAIVGTATVGTAIVGKKAG